MDWLEYDPEWLAVLAEKQKPDLGWLPGALRACTKYSVESVAYHHFVSPENPNKEGSEWQFSGNVVLHHPDKGELVLDILKGKRVGGVEFINRVIEVI